MNLADVLTELSVDFRRGGEHHHITAGWYGADCPRCSPGSGKYKLGLKPDTGAASCWTCGPVRLAEALHEITGRPWSEIKAVLGGWEKESGPEPRPRGKLVLPEGLGPLLPCHRDYLEGRGFDPDELERLWGIKGIALNKRLAWRIWLPVVLGGAIVSWTTRSLSDDAKHRYVTASPEEEALPAKHLLGGEDFVRHVVIVCEGPLDAYRIGPGAVWTSGVSYTAAQVRRIASYPQRVICFDREDRAQQRAWALCRELAGFPGRTENVVLRAADPGSAGRREVNELRRRYLE